MITGNSWTADYVDVTHEVPCITDQVHSPGQDVVLNHIDVSLFIANAEYQGQATWKTKSYGQRVLWEDEKEETTWKTLAQMGR